LRGLGFPFAREVPIKRDPSWSGRRTTHGENRLRPQRSQPQSHEAGAKKAAGIVINAGAYTHTSVAIRDAIAAIAVPVIEVHISNVFARESFRHHSHIAPVAKASLCGFGIEGYALAIEGLAAMIDARQKG